MAVDRVDQFVGGAAVEVIEARGAVHRQHCSYPAGCSVAPGGARQLRGGGAFDSMGMDGTQKDGEHGDRYGQQTQRNHQDYGHG